MVKRGERLQAAVLALLQARRSPLSAYDILHGLNSDHGRLAPTTIYRTLTALVASGAVHRLESRNAFVACQSRCAEAATIFTICDDCGAVEETASGDVLAALSAAAGKIGFEPARHIVEVIGQCAACGAARSAG